ncbi:MAG: hypothetical protein KGL44_03945 [Sphingomonadales bacterium]|nr:hypothetical protein [Sphingomonadales bacterium]
MSGDKDHDIAGAVAAAFDWWREAGVDCDFLIDPVDWLAVPERAHAPQIDAPPPLRAEFAGTDPVVRMAPEPARFGADLPADLAAFEAWWLAEPSLDGGRSDRRVPPRGPAGAEVMVLVTEPEAEDEERLLSGVQGRLLDAMLKAMGFAPDEAYVATALPRHTPLADWPALTAQGLGAVLARHVRLAAPKRLIVLGGNILPLFGNDLPNSAQSLREFNHEGLSLPLLPGPDLAALLARPRGKARVWQQWLELTGQEQS